MLGDSGYSGARNSKHNTHKMKSLLTSLVLLSLGTAALQAQAPAIKVDVKPLKIGQVDTPQFQAGNVGEKRWRPKTWLEVDMEFDIKLPQALGGRNASQDLLQVNYYVALNATTKDGKRIVIKGTFDYVDVPASETCHALAYVSPASLRRLLQKDNFSAASDVQGWGVEVLVGGTRVAGESSIGGGPWWEKTDLLSIESDVMLSKRETPFSILWGDYDVSTKKQ